MQRHAVLSRLITGAAGLRRRPQTPTASVSPSLFSSSSKRLDHPDERRASASRASTSAPSATRYVLGIETSCDDTAAAVVSESGEVLGESILSSVDLQAKFGGVVPNLARQAHEEAIDGVVAEALHAAQLEPSDLSGVAVTIGPGLSLCLKVGVLKAREVAHLGGCPLIPVHHMEAHALVARALAAASSYDDDPLSPAQPAPAFPFLALLVSGGHNLLVLVEGLGVYKILGTTLDDAVGEAYDKVARLLGLDLSRGGGPAVEELALSGDAEAHAFPVPLKNSRDKAKNCDFSFAGLKTSVRTAVERTIGIGGGGGGGLEVGEEAARAKVKADIAASFQRVAVEHLCLRTRTAVLWARETHPGLGEIVVAGGVASNRTLRRELEALALDLDLKLVCPPPRYCTDNGVMVAWTGMERLRAGVGVGECPETPRPEEGEWVELRPRWPLGDLDPRCSQQRQKIRSAKTKNIKMSLTQETALLMAADKARLQRT